jgi:hypothetical protein
MAKKKGQVTPEDTEAMFGDIVDRIPGTVEDSSDQAPAKPKQQPPKPFHSEKATIKVSLYLTPQEINDLDMEIMNRREKTGKSPRRSHLIREAIKMWLSTQN